MSRPTPVALTSTALLALGLALGACGATAPGAAPDRPHTGLHALEPPPRPAPPPPETRAAVIPPAEAVVTLTPIDIDPAVSDACGPVESPAPMFDFDSDRPTPEATARIRRLGECLAGGPLEAAEVVLIGHADPWGDGPYNRDLAERRARAVAGLLESFPTNSGASPSTVPNGEFRRLSASEYFEYSCSFVP